MSTLTINDRLQPFLAAVTVAGFAVTLGAVLSLIAAVSVDHHFRPEPTIADPGQLPMADASIRFEPTHVIPQAITLRVRSADQERFASTLRKDILAHGGWTDSTGAVTRVTRDFSAITMESYLERLRPLMAGADPDEPHPNYQSWVRDTASQPGALAPAPFVQISFQIDRGFTYNPVNGRVIKIALITGGAALGLALVAAAASEPYRERVMRQ